MANYQSMMVQFGAMAGKEPDTGPTAVTVAANVKRLRGEQNLSYTDLSERLQEVADWSVSPVGVRRTKKASAVSPLTTCSLWLWRWVFRPPRC